MPAWTLTGPDQPQTQTPWSLTGPDPEQPQPQPQQKSYSLGDTAASAVNNFVPDASNIINNIANRYGQVGATGIAKDIAKTTIGMAQEMIPGQQQYETQYADPMYRQMSHAWGFDQPTAGAQYEQIKRNIAEHPAQAGLDVSMFAAPLEALPGRVGSVAGTVSRATNPIGAAVRGVTTVAKRAVTPFPARAATIEGANTLAAEGVPTTAGQATGNTALKYAESTIGGGKTTNLIDAQNEAFTQAASRRIGLDSPTLDGPTMATAYKRIGGEIGAIADRNVLKADQPMIKDAYNAEGIYNRRTNPSLRSPIVSQVASEIRNLRGSVPGDVYQSLRSRIGKEAREIKDPEVQHALYGLQRSLDDAMERSVAPADRGAFKAARTQYRNYLVLEDAMAVGGQDTAAGILTPGKLEQAAANRLGRRAYFLRRGNDFADLAKAGKVAMTKMPDSGTPARVAMQAIPTAIGAVLGGGGSAGLGAVTGAIAGKTLAGRGLMSGPVQSYLRNQVLPQQGLSRTGRIAGGVGRVGIGVASHQATLDHAANVLSPGVLKTIQNDPEIRPSLASWVRAHSSGQGEEETAIALADRIAQKVNRPELADRIARELLGSQQ